MRRYKIQAVQRGLVLLVLNSSALLHAQADATNRPPVISISWPRQTNAFSVGIGMKIKANATDPDGSITQVQFWANTNAIGIVTNPPFNILWQVESACCTGYGTWDLKAVAMDNLGAKTESAPVTIRYYSGGPPSPVVEIVSPGDGILFAAHTTFLFSAELLAGLDSGPVEFFVDTNSVGLVGADINAAAPPASITVSNLPIGEHTLTVRFRGLNPTFSTGGAVTRKFL